MIKVTIPEKKQSLDFPMLMISKDGRIILAFHLDENSNYLWGTVIRPEVETANTCGAGYHSTTWDANLYTPYTGPVTLENQETA